MRRVTHEWLNDFVIFQWRIAACALCKTGWGCHVYMTRLEYRYAVASVVMLACCTLRKRLNKLVIFRWFVALMEFERLGECVVCWGDWVSVSCVDETEWICHVLMRLSEFVMCWWDWVSVSCVDEVYRIAVWSETSRVVCNGAWVVCNGACKRVVCNGELYASDSSCM